MTHQQTPALASLLIAPATCGWRVTTFAESGVPSIQEAPSFAEAVAAAFVLSAKPDKSGSHHVPVCVALPMRCGVFERLTLPSKDLEELGFMVRLQFEKSLPYAVEETAFGFQILSQSGSETTLFACAVPHSEATAICAPLLERQFPSRLTLWAMHQAAQAPAEVVACGLWREEEALVFGIFENRSLGFLEIIATDVDLCAALARVLMRAEMAGAPVKFTQVLLDPTLAGMGETLGSYFGAPIHEFLPLSSETPLGDAVDLTPETWKAEQLQKERFLRRRKQAIVAGVVYAFAVVAALIFLALQANRLEGLRKHVAALQPQVDAVIARQTRWNSLTPAIEKQRFAVELLFQTWQCLPTAETRITRFDLSRNQFAVEGEASNAQQAIAFGEKLKARPELAGYRFESAPPVILPNEHAQFRIFGKL